MTVKNFRVSIGLDTNSASVPGVTWALFLMELALIALPLQPDLFMNHHHMLSNSGVWDFDAGPLRVFSSMARILHPGDYVYLLMRSLGCN